MENNQANHITDLSTIREEGILLTGRGTHVVRVRGAFKQVTEPSASNPQQGQK